MRRLDSLRYLEVPNKRLMRRLDSLRYLEVPNKGNNILD